MRLVPSLQPSRTAISGSSGIMYHHVPISCQNHSKSTYKQLAKGTAHTVFNLNKITPKKKRSAIYDPGAFRSKTSSPKSDFFRMTPGSPPNSWMFSVRERTCPRKDSWMISSQGSDSRQPPSPILRYLHWRPAHRPPVRTRMQAATAYATAQQQHTESCEKTTSMVA